MSDNKDTQPHSIFNRRDHAGGEAHRLAADHGDERELARLFRLWSAPETPAALDLRVTTSYRQQIFSTEEERQEVSMKQCPTCQEEFANKFGFCPVDGTPLNEAGGISLPTPDLSHVPLGGTYNAAAALVPAGAEFRLTFIDDTGLTRRLVSELKVVAHNSELTWPEFKRDPFGYTGRFFSGYGRMLWRFFTSRNVAVATSLALFVVMAAVIAVIAYGRYQERYGTEPENDLIVEQLINPGEIPAELPETKPDEAIGAGKGGRVGFANGRGEGSNPKPAKAGGGGGGGNQDLTQVQQGRIPPPSEIATKIPVTPPLRTPPLPAGGINIDPALYKPQDFDRFGDPRSQAKETSAGQGTGSGLGSGSGSGIGEGEGDGFGKGRGRNMGGGPPGDGSGGPGGGTGRDGSLDYTRTFSPKEVTVKARILSRPEPTYTEEARKNQVSGTVVLRAVFSSSGQVTSIRTVSGLPHGLTEKAIAAARLIRFSPAMKDGRPVSQYIQIEYNFNLY